MGRGGEKGFVEHVLPVPGELAFGDDAPGDECVSATVAGKDNRIAHVARRAHAEIHGRRRQWLKGLDEPESGFLIVAEDMAGDGQALVVRDPERLRFGHQIADGQHEAGVADHHAVAHPLCPQHGRGERIFRNLGAHAHQ